MKFQYIAVLSSLVFFWPDAVLARQIQPELRAERVADIIADHVGYPGFRLLVSQNGEIVFTREEGYADIRTGTPFTRHHRSRIYSISKTLTAIVALRLMELGQLDLQAPISAHLPNLPDHVGMLTAHQLLTHSSGIRHYDGDWLSTSHYRCDSPHDAIADFVDDPLVIEPGASFSYSSFGYVLLGAVIEAASGMPFELAVRSYVLEPAGMHATALAGRPVGGYQTVTHYFRSETSPSGFDPTYPEIDVRCKFGGGGYVSTAEDLIRLGNALIDNAFFDNLSTRDLMFTPHFDWGQGNHPAYGYGILPGHPGARFSEIPETLMPELPVAFRVMAAEFDDIDFGEPVHNNGGAAGAFAMFVIYPETGVVAAITANQRDSTDVALLAIAAAYGYPSGNDQ